METFLQFFTDEEAGLPCQADDVPAPRTEWPAALSELQVQVQVQTGAAAANGIVATVRARNPPAAPRRRHTLQRVRASMIGMKTKKAKKTKSKKSKKAEKPRDTSSSVTDHMHPAPRCEVVMNYDWFSLDASQSYADQGECTLMLGPPAV